MIKYVKKEDRFCKYYIRFDDITRLAIGVYKNLDNSRHGINTFKCSPSLYENSDWDFSTQEEFDAKLEFMKKLII